MRDDMYLDVAVVPNETKLTGGTRPGRRPASEASGSTRG